MSDTPKTNAANKIRGFVKANIHKFIIRDTGNIENRIKNNNKILEYFAVIDSRKKEYCMKFDKIDNYDKKPIFVINNSNGNDVILEKQIGSNSVFGVIYKSKFKNDDNISFATKVVLADEDNEYELNILKKLSKVVLEKKCPHFPILFKTLRCLKFNTILDNKDSGFKYYPDLVKDNLNKEFMFLFNELANGDLKTFMRTYYQNTNLIKNALAQVFLSLMFFYHYTENIHRDAHHGNFLFHKINPGGYFHYNILGVDYYVENLGYLWVIWDFSKALSSSNEVMNTDYQNVIGSFYNEKTKFPRSIKVLHGTLPISYTMDETFKQTIVSMYNEMFIDLAQRPLEIKSNLSYTPERMKIYTAWTLSILVKNNLLLTYISPSDTLINDKPYTI
jgi:hypothetical protein